MKLYKYWAKGEATVQTDRRPWKILAYGGSNDSMAEALLRANERASRQAAAIQRGGRQGAYEYADRPLREELIEEIRDGNEVAAVITRNSYGALVLNTNRVMFVDIDFHPASVSLGAALRNVWSSLRGKSAAAKQDREQKMLARFEEVCQAHPGLGFRVYRTSGGFRLLVTSGVYDPTDGDAMKLLEAFGSDPLYIRLCKAQECFRARLSAKFWRCGAKRPPSRFPWADVAEEQRYRAWEEEYHALANKRAVCQLVGTHGAPAVDNAVRPILEAHDRLTLQDGAPLA